MMSTKGKCSPRPPRGGNKDRPSQNQALMRSVNLGGKRERDICVVDTPVKPVFDTTVEFLKEEELDPVLAALWVEEGRARGSTNPDISKLEPCQNQIFGNSFWPAECGRCRQTLNSFYDHFMHRNESSACVGYVSFCDVCRVFFKGGKGLSMHLKRSVCSRVEEAQSGIVSELDKRVEDEFSRKDNCSDSIIEDVIPTVDELPLKEFRVVLKKCDDDMLGSKDSKCSICSKQCKSVRGLKMHHSRSLCGEVISTQVSNASQLLSRCSTERNAPEALSSQEINHSAMAGLPNNCETERMLLARLPVRKPVKWPRMMDDARWHELDKVVHGQLPPELFPAEKKLSSLEVVVYEEAARIFGFVERKERVFHESRRQVKIREIRTNIKGLLRRLKETELEEVRLGLLCVLDDLKVKRRELRRTETKRKRKWKRAKWRRHFYTDPFATAREVLDPQVKCSLEVGKEVLNDYVRVVASDPLRNEVLAPLDGLEGTVEPKKQYYLGKLCQGKFQFSLRRKRNKSRPGPNQLPYKLYKKCPLLQDYLFGIISSMYSSGTVPLSWRISDGIFIPKVDVPNSMAIEDFRQIALMNVEGKLWWSMISDGLYKYLVTDNGFIDTKVQKGSIKNTPGCWEHTSMIWSALKHCKNSNKSLAVLWLDLANAYGSVPHQLIIFALRRYRVPEKIIGLVLKYYWGLWGRSSSRVASSDWCQYEVGVFAGCTLSVILFLLAFNIVVEYLKIDGTVCFVLADGLEIEPFRAFMDDLSILTPSVLETERALRKTVAVLEWARMRLKAQKSRSLVISGGRPLAVEPFSVGGVVIPSLQEKPLKTLGRFYDSTITDGKIRDELKAKFLEGLNKIDKCQLSGFMKVWTLQHLLLPKVQWHLMLYEISLTWVEKLERKVSVHIRKWMGVSRNLTGVALYSREVPCPFRISSLTSVYRATKTNAYLQLTQSNDRQVKLGATEVKTGRAWSASKAVQASEDRLWQEELVGLVPDGRSGFGMKKTRKKGDLRGVVASSGQAEVESKGARAIWNACARSKGRQYRQAVLAKLRDQENEKLMTTAVQQSLQGQWTRWKDVIQRDFSWKSLLSMRPNLVRFAIGATYDTLSSPTNLKRWGISDDSQCVLCGCKECTIAHVLSHCITGLNQGRFTFRHDSVLRVLADGILRYIRCGRTQKEVRRSVVVFVKEGDKVKDDTRRATPPGILDEASDWDFLVDLKPSLVFPEDVADTTLRPDIVIVSRRKKIVVIIELTCPCEENFSARHQDKLNRYEDLVSLCTGNGWKVHLFALEVGARGYACDTVVSCVRKLGICPGASKILSRNAADAALRASFWIWICRETKEWGKAPDWSCSGESQQPTLRNDLNESTKWNCRGVALSVNRQSQASVSEGDRSVGLDLRESGAVCRVEKIKFSKGPNLELEPALASANVKPRGLRNLGNTCFLNAVLQCVFATISMPETAAAGLMKPLQDLFLSWNGAGREISPTVFLREFCKRFIGFRNRVPHDANECIVSLFSDQSLTSLATQVAASLVTVRRCGSCQYESSDMQSLTVHNLQVHASSSVQNLLERAQNPRAEEEVACHQCGRLDVVTTESVCDTKRVMLVSLKRFAQIGNAIRKVDTSLLFPLSPIEVEGVQRFPRGVVIHEGSRNSGHYHALVLKNYIWYNCSDGSVKRVNLRRAKELAAKGYIFFYN